ncbi:VWA domain-containing protein [Granulosicoccaceae sp. 1_MG-2023]|nr:VWA domain-containing protein [Granulosicoccaceae sp. 1_MG-2023]
MAEWHFLRPAWFALLILLVPAVLLLWQRRTGAARWQGVIDPALMPYVLNSPAADRQRWPAVVLGVFGLAAIIALAGPVWQRLPVPLSRAVQPLVIVLDLSRSMDAADVRPSRLARARFKIDDVLRLNPDRQTGLVVFSEVPYTVSPITDDVATVATFLPSLTTDVVPVQGANTALALEKAAELIANSRYPKADILLISDSAPGEAALAVAGGLPAAGISLSVLGVGTAEGAPVRLSDGSLLKDADGAIVTPALAEQGLQALAAAAGGRYRRLGTGDADLRYLLPDAPVAVEAPQESQSARRADQWIEYAPWLLPLLMLPGLLLFRRGML